jgi:hypothetical protein
MRGFGGLSEARGAYATGEKRLDDNGATPGNDPGLACLVIIAHFHGVAADPQQLRHQSGRGALSGAFGERDLLLAAKSLGLKSRQVELRAERLSSTPLPALMLDRLERHFILARISADGSALIQEGSESRPDRHFSRRGATALGRARDFVCLARLAGRRVNALRFLVVHSLDYQVPPLSARGAAAVHDSAVGRISLTADVSGGDGQGVG